MESQIRYQFAVLEKLVLREEPNSLKLDDEITLIKQKFPVLTFEMVDVLQVRQYVRFHQYALVRLMDQLKGIRNQGAVLAAYRKLNDVLEFLATDFKSFFDLDAKAPESHISIARKNSRKHLARLTILLKERGVDHHLIEVSLQSLHRLEKEYQNLSISFRRISFANEVQSTIYELVNDGQSKLEEQLELTLFRLNCNSIKVFMYWTQLFQKQFGVIDSNQDRIEKLAFALKSVNQIQIKHGIGYNVHGTSLKELVSGYLIEEISYLERVTPSPAPGSPSDKLIHDFKLRVNLSVSQVAYVFRIFIENHLIQTKNQTELLKFLARVVITKKAENVSFDSLRAKYYNIETGTKESVRETLSSLVRYVDKN
jgi:hypothetical protein